MLPTRRSSFPRCWMSPPRWRASRQLAAREAQPRLMALLAAAGERGLPQVLDETLLTLGAGDGGRDFPLQGLSRDRRRTLE